MKNDQPNISPPLVEDGGPAWRPIETAPKDGDFLAHIANGYITRGRFHGGRFFAADSFGPSSKNNDTRPTHWMPLPEPPLAARSSREVVK